MAHALYIVCTLQFGLLDEATRESNENPYAISRAHIFRDMLQLQNGRSTITVRGADDWIHRREGKAGARARHRTRPAAGLQGARRRCAPCIEDPASIRQAVRDLASP